MESVKSFPMTVAASQLSPTPLSQQGAQISGINFTFKWPQCISVTSKGLFDEGTCLLG